VPHFHPALPDHRPFIVAHRAGNHIAKAERAIRRGADMLEADVWRYRKRLEVRHLKTLGPLPILWDRWELAPGWTPRLHLHELLEATPADVPIMFDLKGEDANLSMSVVEAMREDHPERPIIMCTRFWIQLDRIRDEADVHRIYSVGSEKERDGIFSRLDGIEYPAVSIHHNLVTPGLMRRFDEAGAVVMSWGATTRAEAEMLLSLGVDGLTVSEGPLQRWLLAERQGRNGTVTNTAAGGTSASGETA
jgi:glycerophosphoryl diester phosphodiesterase